MGNTHSTGQSKDSKQCGIICNCFLNDKHVQLVDAHRNCKIRWIWSDSHQSMFTQMLKSEYCDIPKEIILLMTTFISSTSDNYYITKSAVLSAKTYQSKSSLLKKSLCIPYISKAHRNTDITIILIGHQCSDIIQSFSCQYLPALQLSFGVTRTINMNNYQFRVKLVSDQHYNISDDEKVIYLLQCNDKAAVKTFCVTDDYRATNTILFGNLNENIVSDHNNIIPYLKVNGKKDNEVNMLFHFAIKYHLWFKHVFASSVL